MSARAEAEAPVGGGASDANLNVAQTQSSGKGGCSIRHGLAFLLHLCNFSVYTQQMSLSIAIPAMVNDTALPSPPSASPEGPPTYPPHGRNHTRTALEAAAPRYDWSPETQGVLLSALNYGSLLASTPSGYVAGVLGAKYLVGAAMVISSVLHLCVPLVADAGVASLVALRAVQGVAQAMVLIGQYSIWVKWAPPLERNQLITIAVAGSLLGSVIVLLAGGFLCQTMGWPSVFYIFGGVGCACACLWFPFFYDDPVDHPFISAQERDYVVRSLAAQQDRAPEWAVPLRAMLGSLPLWGILVSHLTVHWYLYILMAYTPTYISSVLRVGLSDSGFLTALLMGVTFICTILGGLLADFLLSRKILSLVVIRKLFTAVGVLVPAALSVSLSWVRSSVGATMALLGLSYATLSFCQVGVFVNFLDVAPRYAAFLRGLLFGVSQLSGTVSPTVAGVFLSQDAEFGWRNTFLLSAAVSTSGLVFYLVVGQAEVQEWAKEQTSTRL